MNLESLPNELLLHLFSYLDGSDLLRAFYGLNIRFNQLLYQQFRHYHFYFSSPSKANFDWTCQKHLPLIADHVSSLQLTEYSMCPGKTNLFFTYIPSLNHFVHLQSLNVSRINSSEILMIIVNALPYLLHLISLNLHYGNHHEGEIDLKLIINNVWNLPRLVHCCLSLFSRNQEAISSPTKQSTSIKDLYLTGLRSKTDDIHSLLNQTPNLESLSIGIHWNDQKTSTPFSLPRLTDLQIHVQTSADYSILESLLKSAANLRRLNVIMNQICIDGNQWEQFIRTYSTKLKVFTLDMNHTYDSNANIQQIFDELCQSFRSSFWIDEHKWYVRCIKYDQSIHIHTQDTCVFCLHKTVPDVCCSTSPSDCQENIDNVMEHIDAEAFVNQSFPSDICLSNITSLRTKLPLPDQFWSVVPNLNRLSTLTILFDNDTSSSHLQTLLDLTPKLHCLYIKQEAPLTFNRSLFTCTNSSVHTWCLKEYQYQFHEEECLELAQSPLGKQCKYLFIHVKHCQDIVILIESMPNLRILDVTVENTSFQDILYGITNREAYNEDIAKRNGIIRWLHDQLPTTCYVSVHPKSATIIHIWIR